jgi:hypothetical protein
MEEIETREVRLPNELLLGVEKQLFIFAHRVGI